MSQKSHTICWWISTVLVALGLTISTSSVGSAWVHKRYLYPHPRTRGSFSLLSLQQSKVQGDVSQYRTLYPASEAHTNGTLQVDEIHNLYFEIHGHGSLNALFLHGGPGAGCSPNHARFFDPNRYTIVLLDQRGSGRSTPRGCIENNTLSHLVLDCDHLRQKLGIDSWDVILGGSWGTTVALGYGQTLPWSMKSLILRGIFTLRRSEVDWLFNANGGAARQFAHAWNDFSDAVDTPEEDNKSDCDGRKTLHAYYDRLLGSNNETRLAAARSWMKYEFTVTSSLQNQTNDHNTTVLVSAPCQEGSSWIFENNNGESIRPLNLAPDVVASRLRLGVKKDHHSAEEQIDGLSRPRPVRYNIEITNTTRPPGKFDNGTGVPVNFVPALQMLTCFYSVNERYVLGDMANLLDRHRMMRLSDIVCIGVQGGMDRICPPDTALDLLEVLPTMELRIPLAAGHSMYDPAITHELVMATDRLADRFSAVV